MVSVSGNGKFFEHYTEKKTDEDNKVCIKLTQLAKTSLENAYFCTTRGVPEKLSFMFRAIPNLVVMFGKSESTLTKKSSHWL